MQIKSSTALRNEYTAISALAKETQEPIYITVNGEGDGVFMDIDAFEKREAIFKLRARIMDAEQQRIQGAPTKSIEEVRKYLDERLGS